MQLSKEIKEQLILAEIAQYETSMYTYSLRARAAKVVENETGIKEAEKIIENHIKVIDFLNKELEKVKNAAEKG